MTLSSVVHSDVAAPSYDFVPVGKVLQSTVANNITVPIAENWINYIFLVLTGSLNGVDTVARHRRPA